MGGVIFFTLVVPALIMLGIVGLIYGLYVYKFRYVQVMANEVLFVTGRGLKGENVFTEQGRQIMVQRSNYRLRLFQSGKKESLNSFQIHLKTPTVIVQGGIPVVVDAVATVKISDSPSQMVKYAEQYLGKDSKTISKEIENVLSPNLRAVLSRLSIEEINNDRERFSEEVKEIVETQLSAMGFEITSFGLEDVRDADAGGYLSNLGRPRLASMTERAEKAESDALRNIRIHKAENDKQAKEEETRRIIEIAEIEKESELLKQRNLAETSKERAITEQTYELERAKREREVEYERLSIELMQKEETLKQEEIDKQQAIIKAQREAEESRIRAEAHKERQRLEGEALMELGKSEAQVILEKGKAEAESRALMAKAIQDYGEVAVIEMVVQALPLMAKEFANAYSNIDEIKIIDMGGNGDGANALTKDVIKNMTGLQEVLEETVGINFSELVDTLASRGRNKLGDSLGNFTDSNQLQQLGELLREQEGTEEGTKQPQEVVNEETKPVGTKNGYQANREEIDVLPVEE